MLVVVGEELLADRFPAASEPPQLAQINATQKGATAATAPYPLRRRTRVTPQAMAPLAFDNTIGLLGRIAEPVVGVGAVARLCTALPHLFPTSGQPAEKVGVGGRAVGGSLIRRQLVPETRPIAVIHPYLNARAAPR